MVKIADKVLKFLGRVSYFAYRAGLFIMVIYVFLVTIIVLGEVISRNILGAPIPWAEEASRWLLIGTTFIGASVAFREGAHVGVTMLVKKLPKTLMKLIILITNIIVFVILWHVFWQGIAISMAGLNITGDIILIPLFYVRINIPVGTALMALHLLYYLFGALLSDSPDSYLISRPVAVEEEVSRGE